MSQRAFSRIWILIIAAVIIAGGVLIWQYWPRTAGQEQDETTDWQTYRNEEYNYEVKYPSDWVFEYTPVVQEKKPYSVVWFGPSTSFLPVSIFTDFDVFGLINDLSLSDAVKLMIGDVSLIENYLEVDNVSAIEVREPGIEESTSVFFQNQDGLLFRISLTPADYEHSDTFNQILSTFRFLEE